MEKNILRNFNQIGHQKMQERIQVKILNLEISALRAQRTAIWINYSVEISSDASALQCSQICGPNIIREALENLVLKKSFVSRIPSFLSNQMKGQRDIWQHFYPQIIENETDRTLRKFRRANEKFDIPAEATDLQHSDTP